MSEEEMLAGVCMDDLPDQSLADMVAADAKIPVSVKDQGSYNIALTAVLDSAKADSQSAVAAHVATEDPHAQYIRGTEIGETLCPLEGGVIPSRFFPASYDEVQYYDSLDDFPSSGVDNVIYVSRNDGFTWRWGGEAYHRLNASLALGETADTAYPGNKGKVAYDHALAEGNPHRTTPTDIGLGNVDNSSDADKPVSTATATAISTASTADRNRENHTGTQAASTISDFAATVLGTVLTGLSTATNAAIAATDTVLGGLGKLQAQITANLTSLTSHTSNTNNPHGVTKTQIGLGNVDNTSDADKPVSTATATALANKEPLWARANIASETDWDSLTSPGSYRVDNWTGGTNGPTGAYGWGELLVSVSTNTNHVLQMYHPHRGPNTPANGLFSRVKYDTWTAWCHYADSAALGDYVSKTTTDAQSIEGGLSVGASAGDDASGLLLRLNADRPWAFVQNGGNSLAQVHLKCESDAKYFSIVNAEGDKLVDFYARSGGLSQTTFLRPLYLGGNAIPAANDNSYRVPCTAWTAKRATGTTLSLSSGASVTSAQFVNGITFLVPNGASVTLPPTVGAIGERCFFSMTGCSGGNITVNGVYKSSTQNYFGIIAEKNAVGWSVC